MSNVPHSRWWYLKALVGNIWCNHEPAKARQQCNAKARNLIHPAYGSGAMHTRLFRIREKSIYRSLRMYSAQRKYKTFPRHVKDLACGGEALANFIDSGRLTYMQGT